MIIQAINILLLTASTNWSY